MIMLSEYYLNFRNYLGIAFLFCCRNTCSGSFSTKFISDLIAQKDKIDKEKKIRDIA